MTTEHQTLQEQIVALRLRIDSQAEAQAALIRHMVEKEIASQMDDRLPTDEQTRYLAELLEREKAARKAKTELLLHLAKMGAAGGAGFVLWALWESIKAKLTFVGKG